MNIQRINAKDFVVNQWSGGTTKQLVIEPSDSNLGERNFLWRVSSATFTDTKSKFSDFTGYTRYLLPLQGELSLTHLGQYKRSLKPYEVEKFSGSWQTESENTEDCVDFNLILKDELKSRLEILRENEKYSASQIGILCVFSTTSFRLCFEGENAQSFRLKPWELLMIRSDQIPNLWVEEINSPVILWEIEDIGNK